jgi:hypothetical protein
MYGISEPRLSIKPVLNIALVVSMLLVSSFSLAQVKYPTPKSSPFGREEASTAPVDQTPAAGDPDQSTTSLIAPIKLPARPPAPGGSGAKAEDGPPLTDRERALLELIRDLQERVNRLESKGVDQNATAWPTGRKPGPVNATNPTQSDSTAEIISLRHEPSSDAGSVDAGIPLSPVSGAATGNEADPIFQPAATPSAQEPEPAKWGTYTPNLGFKLANTKYGDLSLSIYTYIRYLNQLNLDSTYTDAFGNVKNVQRRQDIQIQKLQFKFLGWLLNEKFRYFLYAWTSNANQGQGAQVVLAGNLSYSFNKYITVAAGIRSLPGTRSVEGQFPLWLGVDSRMIADEFFRPSYTDGVWAAGQITDRLKYQVMLGNNMSILGVSAARLDNNINTFSSALVWNPTGDLGKGFSGGWGDFEHNETLHTRLAVHFSRSDENKESQPSSDTFENTQLRLSDGNVIFTPNLFGDGITIEDARWRMASFDGALKYRGWALEGEYYLRWLDDFRGEGTEGLKNIFDHGFQIQGSAMVIPQTLQAYLGHSRIFGKYGDPWDLRGGVNFFPWKNKVVRWNAEGLYLYKSPVGYTSVPFALGGRGFVFHTSFELAF